MRIRKRKRTCRYAHRSAATRNDCPSAIYRNSLSRTGAARARADSRSLSIRPIPITVNVLEVTNTVHCETEREMHVTLKVGNNRAGVQGKEGMISADSKNKERKSANAGGSRVVRWTIFQEI